LTVLLNNTLTNHREAETVLNATGNIRKRYEVLKQWNLDCGCFCLRHLLFQG
jgi:hypothetical protein